MQASHPDAHEQLATELARLGVTAEILGDGYHLGDDGWEHHRVACTLARDGRDFWTGPFRQGLGIDRDPEIADVFGALVMDARCYSDTTDLADFLCEFGYHEDGAKGIRRGSDAYAACGATHAALQGAFTNAELDRLEELAAEL
jgi:hypothetical protein